MTNRQKMHFEVSERKILLRLFDLVFVFGALHLLGLFFHFDYFIVSATQKTNIVVLSMYLMLLGTVFEMYNLQVATNQYQIVKSTLLTATTTAIFYLLTPIFTPLLPSNRIQIIYFFLGVLLGLLLWRLIYQRLFASQRFEKRAVLVCDSLECDGLVLALEESNPHYNVAAVFLLDGTRKVDYVSKSLKEQDTQLDLVRYVHTNSISEIVVASNHKGGITSGLYHQILILLEYGFNIREYTQVYESNTYRIPIQHFDTDFYRYFPFSRSNRNRLYLYLVRIFEVVFSLIGMAFGLVLVPFILLGNLITSRGPLFYTQTRVGRHGIPFEIHKFRTMRVNAEKDGAVMSTIGDSRITPMGKIMRKTRIDEFPQFINILKGEMGFIGPRPERPHFVAELAAVMPFYETRHVIKPGLTGWAQVNYSYGETLEDSLIKLQYDLYYIKHRSIFLDFNIVIKTFSTVLFYRGQ
ncbi:exopolysaccharide biosynthesis polyprenyl glycosylphosphotransferase [Flavobacterium sp. SM2513]|uniref:exopolysaccharide biosynthesis polyprenyl glycosylphosphotransferase n=1 Tax=Flavobacterium sp. SM2513 TaxID=3424766 RepID=UPI003D7F62FC